eukprot:TRINITY_DN733_c0_g4_i2.p1 TRINITY_DN733_c0_g4~~TRINITY_DN733_c0_g4_i2.p1  ORF type:complete len:330 (+),score=44.82 TRINITY_DN733_c0_g4_i2:167-1156(+)
MKVSPNNIFRDDHHKDIDEDEGSKLRGYSFDKELRSGKFDESLLLDIQRMCLFANATYGTIVTGLNEKKFRFKMTKNFNQAFCISTGMTEKDILYFFWKTIPHRPAYLIAKDSDARSIYVCMRGSKDLADWGTNLLCVYSHLSVYLDKENTDRLFLKVRSSDASLASRIQRKIDEIQGFESNNCIGINDGLPLASGYLHSGMFLAAMDTYKVVTEQLEKIFEQKEFQDYNLVFTGHSLGGAVSLLLCFLYMIKPLHAMGRSMIQRIQCFTYGSAPVFSEHFRPFFAESGLPLYNVVYYDDIVPRFSLGSTKDLVAVIKDIQSFRVNIFS